MKKKFLLITTLLMLSLAGCGSASSSTDAPTEQAEAMVTDDFDYTQKIKEFPVEMECIRRVVYGKNVYDNYALRMTEPTITETTDEYIIATGILDDGVNATVEPIMVKYNIVVNETTGSHNFYTAEVLTEGECWLTPIIEFDTDLLYDFYADGYFFTTSADSYDSEQREFTKDTVPTIILDEAGWEDNYNYSGSVTTIDAEGNKYISRDIEDFVFDIDDVAWRTGDPQSSLVVLAAE